MPFDLSTRRRELTDLLTEDLAAALTALREFLPENTEKHGLVLALRARLNDANKERIRNTISPEEYQRRVDTIRAECFDLLNGLEVADFEVSADKPASAKATAGRQGSVLYRVPHQMPLRKPSICTIRVAIDEDAILEDIVLDDNVRVRPRVEVSDMMRAELLDPEGEVFSIRPLSEKEQLVREQGYTQWLFAVTPQVEGEHQLLVKVSMMEYNAQLGRYVPREVSVLETVTIVTETAVSELEEQLPLKSTGEQIAIGPAAAPTRGLEQAPAPPAPSGGAKPSTIYVPPPYTPPAYTPPPVMEPPAPASKPSTIYVPASPAYTPPPAPAPKPSTIYVPSQPVYTPPPAVEPPAPAPKRRNSSVRAIAVFLILLVGGSSATWALTPPPTRSWWVASLRDSPEAYAGYKEKFKDDPRAKDKVETATFRIADKTGELSDLREYISEYQDGGRYLTQVVARIDTLEVRQLRQLVRQPEAVRILKFVEDFPDSKRLLEVATAAATQSEVLHAVQPDLETALLRKVETATIAAEIQAVLPALEKAGSSSALAKAAQLIEQKPQIKAQIQPQLRQTSERVRQREKAAREAVQLSAAEAKDWADAEAARTARAFVDFVNKYPKTGLLSEARNRINALKPTLSPEEQSWADATLANTPQAFIYFVQKYPRSGRNTAARARIRTFSLSIREQKRLETEAAERLAREQAEAQKKETGQSETKPETQPSSPTNDTPVAPVKSAGERSGLTMVPVKGGAFTMGCQDGRDKDCYPEEKPAHTVTLSGFQIGKYEVTQADWRAVMGDNPSNFKNCDDCPVEQVSWDKIQDFLKKLNAREPGKNYRLPTEAEWEYAARGGHKMPQDIALMSAYAGGNDIGKVAWYSDNSGSKTHPVGQKAPNALGLYDMSGNVWEWCNDWYDDYPEGAQTNPKGVKSGSGRVSRGGSWRNSSQRCRAAHRNLNPPTLRIHVLGFRLACSSF